MAFISLKWFAGMVPRLGSQHLGAPHATAAENCNLYSGELRPLKKPALAHQFCQPTDDCFHSPIPQDPSVPPEPPPEPPNCIPVVITSEPLPPCAGYECDAIGTAFNSVGGLYFLNRGYASDVTDSAGGDYAGPAVNIAVGSAYSEDGYFSIGSTNSIPPDTFGQCSTENVLSWFGGGGSTTSLSHTQTYPDYYGLVDNHWMGGIFWPGSVVEGGNSLRAISTFEWSTAVNNIGDIRWHPDTGYVEFVTGDQSDSFVRVQVGDTSLELKAFDTEGNPRWVFISWHLIRTEADITVYVYAAGDLVFTLYADETVYGSSISSRSWWHTDTANKAGTRVPQWGTGSGLRAAFKGRILYSWIAPSSFDPSQLVDIQQGIEQQTLGYINPDPICSGEIIEGGTGVVLTVGVNADATAPVQYQWLQDNQALPGEVGPVLSLTLEPDDSYTSFTVFVQNPCGEQISLPVPFGEITDVPVCKQYECDAYDDALRSAGLTAYYPGTDGYDGTSEVSNPTSWSGKQVLDAVGPYDLTITDNIGHAFEPLGPVLNAGQCTNTAFEMLTQTGSQWMRSVKDVGANMTGEGVIGVIYDQLPSGSGVDNAILAVSWWTGGQQLQISGSEGDPRIDYITFATNGSVPATGEIRLTDYGYATTAETGQLVSVSWHPETQGELGTRIDCYHNWVLVTSQWFPGTIGGAVPSRDDFRIYACLNGGYAFTNAFYRNSSVTGAEVSTFKAARLQNQPDYTDPNPNCRPPV